MSRSKPANKYERDLLENIKRHGWQCTSVVSDKSSPPFSYTIGLYKSFGYPELMIFGLEHSVAHGILGVAARAAGSGRPIAPQGQTDRLLNGYSSAFVAVPKTEYENYVLSALWYYQGSNFPLFQIVWPSASGRFPWHASEPPSFALEQPVLGMPPAGI